MGKPIHKFAVSFIGCAAILALPVAVFELLLSTPFFTHSTVTVENQSAHALRNVRIGCDGRTYWTGEIKPADRALAAGNGGEGTINLSFEADGRSVVMASYYCTSGMRRDYRFRVTPALDVDFQMAGDMTWARLPFPDDAPPTEN